MKTNYNLKTLKKSLGILAIALGSTFVSAQESTEYFENLRSDADITEYPAGAVSLVSEDLTLEGVTFKIQVTVTPGGNGTFVGTTGSNRRWGIGSDDADNNSSTIDGNYGESVTIDEISVVDFNDNGTGYTIDAISNLHFNAVTLRSVNGDQDNPRITVNGSNSGTFDLGSTTNTATETIVFGEEVVNVVTPVTIGTTNDVTSITLANATEHFQNSFQVVGTNVSYTFTTDSELSVGDVSINVADAFKLSPNPVKANISLNTAIYSAEIVDITGKVVKTYVDNVENLDVSNLVSGIYILKGFSSEGIILTKKFIKE